MEFPDERKTGSHEAAESALLRNDLSSVIPTNHRRGAGRATLFRDSRGGCLYMSICFSIAALIRILLNGYNWKFIGFSEEAGYGFAGILGSPEGAALDLFLQHCDYAGAGYFDWHGGVFWSEGQGRAESLGRYSAYCSFPQADVGSVCADCQAVGAQRGQHQYGIDHQESAQAAAGAAARS